MFIIFIMGIIYVFCRMNSEGDSEGPNRLPPAKKRQDAGRFKDSQDMVTATLHAEQDYKVRENEIFYLFLSFDSSSEPTL